MAVSLIAVSILSSNLYADIVITKDDMILNGKILEDKKPQYLILANYHGTFTIKYSVIKEIHRTESFEEDIKIFRNIGKEINDEEIKKNYTAGEKEMKERLQKQKKEKTDEQKPEETGTILFSIFHDKNTGELEGVLPYSSGISISAEFIAPPLPVLKNIDIYGYGGNISYYYSADNDRQIKGFNLSAGPVWRFPASLSGYEFDLKIAPFLGAGWYSIVNNEVDKETGALKMNFTFQAGPDFRFGSLVVSTRFRLNYIHDSSAPMKGAGLAIGAGYAF